MIKRTIFATVALMLVTDYASGKGSLAAVSAKQDAVFVDSAALPITQVDYQDPIASELVQPPSIAGTIDGTINSAVPQPLPQIDILPHTGPLTMETQ